MVLGLDAWTPRATWVLSEGRARKGGDVWAAHLDNKRVLKHGIAHDPQPLVLHARPDVCHGQGPSWGWADLADGAAHWLLLLPWQEVLAGALDLWHLGGRGESTRGLDAARFPAGGPAGSSEEPTTWTPLLGPHYLGWAQDVGLAPERGTPTSGAPLFERTLLVHISPSGRSEHLLGTLLRMGKGEKTKTTP